MSDSDRRSVVLVVSDKRMVLRYLRDALEPVYDVVEALDGFQGFNLAKKITPDLVISDIHIPVMDGIRLCKVLKNDDEIGLTPVILLSCESEEASIIKGFESGADDCIGWPFNINILKVRIKSRIYNRKLLLEKVEFGDKLPSTQPNQYTQPENESTDAEFIEQTREVLEDNLSNPLFTVEEMAEKLYMSRSTLYRKIQSLTGDSPQMFIRSYRMHRAAQLLENNCGNVTEVCFQVGFTSTAYFAKCFKDIYHQAPRFFTGNGIDSFQDPSVSIEAGT
ncbi:MAG: response regulator [bacterium]|nr:response regulator [bacterium]